MKQRIESMSKKKEELLAVIEKLLEEIDEEDVGISLFAMHSQDEKELSFFCGPDRDRVRKILKKLSDDSKRHKKLIEKIISHLEVKCHET